MASTPIRSFVKGVVWETIGFLLTLLAVYIVYGNFGGALMFSLILTGAKMIFFFLHERVWKRIRWGKYHIINGRVIYEDPKEKRRHKRRKK